MKPIIDQEAYQKQIYRMFGMFPFLLLILMCVVVYGVNVVRALISEGTLTNYLEPQLLADSFFWGVVVTVVVFILTRMSAIRASEKSKDLMELDEEGVYITCMTHNKPLDMTVGNLIITQERLYFQPDRQMAMELAFDYKGYSGFTISLSAPKKSIGLFLITRETHMVEIKDRSGKVVGTFIMPNPEENIKLIKARM